MTTAAAAAAAYDSSEEERSLLFRDSEPESTGDSNNNISDIDNDDLQWEDFMIDYWSHNTNSSSSDEQQLDITANADMIAMMEDSDMTPHPLEPELDDISHLIGNHFNYPTKQQHDMNIIDDVIVDSTAMTPIDKVLCEIGLQSTVQMAKLNATAADINHSSKSSRQTVKKKQQQQLLQEEFVIDMSRVPMPSSSGGGGGGGKSKRKKRAGGGIGSAQINQQVSSPGTRSESSRDTNYYSQSTLAMVHPPAPSLQQQLQQREGSLEDSLFVMAKRLSPGNDDHILLQQQQQQRDVDKQHQPSQQQQQHRRQHSATSSTTTSDTKMKLNSIKSITTTLPPPPPPPPPDSPLPNPSLIHQMGPIQTRTSLRSLLMKKWHPSWWMHYDTHSILIFRSKDHLDDWVQNPYHGRRERAYLVKLRVDFGDIVGASSGSGGGSGVHLVNTSSNSGESSSSSPVQGSSSSNNNTKESGNILGHRILPIKRKSYNKNEPEMYQFKLERWTNMGVSVLAAFASEEEKEVELLYETIGRIMESCPFGGLHDIEHMLQH